MSQKINRIHYGHGMLKQVSEQTKVRPRVYLASELPKEVLHRVQEQDLFELGGVFGNPDMAGPIEFDQLRIEFESSTVEITVYNRGVLLFTTDSEELRRIHRACCAMKDLEEAP